MKALSYKVNDTHAKPAPATDLPDKCAVLMDKMGEIDEIKPNQIERIVLSSGNKNKHLTKLRGKLKTTTERQR